MPSATVIPFAVITAPSPITVSCAMQLGAARWNTSSATITTGAATNGAATTGADTTGAAATRAEPWFRGVEACRGRVEA
eukprot:2272549-Prymnesium_polylepis.1